MSCNCNHPEQKKDDRHFPPEVLEILNPENLVLFRKVVIPASLGDETMVPPVIGKYCNVLLNYEANNHSYLYSSDGIPTKLTADVSADLEARIETLEAEMPITFTDTEWNAYWNS